MRTLPEDEYQQLVEARADRDRLASLINQPELDQFLRAVHIEAVHQVERWGTAHDRAKRPADWFWLVGYLAGKALHAATAADGDKAQHHCISTAAALYNWHCAVTGRDVSMCPGRSDLAALIDGTFPGETEQPALGEALPRATAAAEKARQPLSDERAAFDRWACVERPSLYKPPFGEAAGTWLLDAAWLAWKARASLDSIASVVGLRDQEQPVGIAPSVYQPVPVSAARADEVKSLLVDFGGQILEQELQPAASASPHDGSPTG